MIKLKDIVQGKVYTDKDRQPFKVNEEKEGKMAKHDAMECASDSKDVSSMIQDETDLPEWLEAKITISKENMNAEKDYLTHHTDLGNMNEGWDSPQAYSSKEAKAVIDGSIRNYAKDLRKVQYRVIKDWMSKAKSGTIDYFDLVRGMQTGDIARAKPFETKFLMAVLNRDKIMDRFRKYFGGKKGKSGRRK